MRKTYPKGIVFDLDGTLVDTAPDLLAQLKIVLDRLGVRLSPLKMRDFIGGGARPLIERSLAAAGIAPDEARLNQIETEFIALYSENCTKHSRPFPDVLKVLENLAEAHIAMSVCTNKRQDLAEKVLRGFGLDRFFLSVIGRDASRPSKPDAAALNGILQKTKLAAKEMVMVGDSITDIQFARATGMKALAVSFGYSAEPIHQLGADYVIDHWRDMLPTLEMIGQSV